MSLIGSLVGFALRQVIGEGVENVFDAVEQRFRDHSQTLPNALERAHERSWQALGVALAGDGFFDRVKVFFTDRDDKGIREQVQLFLQGNDFSFAGTPAEFREKCLNEFKRLRKSGMLSTREPAAEIARQAAAFQRHTDPGGMIDGARQGVEQVADAIRENYPNLAKLLRAPTPTGPPLLAAAFCYFFRREVETDDELAHGLFFDGLRQLTATQAKAFGEINRALSALGGQFDALFDQLGRIETAVIETHGAVLDLQAELQRLGGLHLVNADEVRGLLLQVQQHLTRIGMQRGEVHPNHSSIIRSEDERRAVKALLARFRQLPPEEQQQVPALLNGLGKLQVGAGDFTAARQTFIEVVEVAENPAARAEASFNAYRAALEERKWDAALEALRQAAALDPGRFAPFPLHRYEPQRILGAGGFGTVVLCHDRNFDEDVVVKALHAADLDRTLGDVFREARILRELSDPAIIRVRDCEYADPVAKARPYLVMDYFAGGTLEQFIDQRGPLTVEQLLPVALQIARGMRTVHSQGGVLHRDLKPANVLVRKQGDEWQVKVIDFGLALRRQTIETSMPVQSEAKTILGGSVAGTLKYAPPEQMGELRGIKPGPYSDVYAFGKTCCYALFRTTEPKSRHWASIPKELVEMLERCTDQDLKHRHAGFEPVLEVLEALDPGRRQREEEERQRQEEAARRKQEEQTRQQREEEVRRAAAEAARRQREEEQRRQWELADLQQQGEAKLARLVRESLEHTGGRPTAEDTVAANELVRHHHITKERAKAIVAEVWQQWKKERQGREKRPQEQEIPEAYAVPRWEEEEAAAEQIRAPKAGEVLAVSLGAYFEMKFAWIPPGTFLMGSPRSEPERRDDEVQHRVTLTRGFWLGIYPVTQAQWQLVMGSNPSLFKGDNRPVEMVSWDDCQEFCRKLGEKKGKRFRLPTEAEWEYACRAGTTTPFHFGDTLSTERANYDGNFTYGKGKEGTCREQTTPVGSFLANAWGLFDMHGNVWEWCEDLYAPYDRSDVTDPVAGALSAVHVKKGSRVLRGGCWCSRPGICRSAFRHWSAPVGCSRYLGCRVCLCVD
jgi:formylglycine-generating enzyme required for sulfatase activity